MVRPVSRRVDRRSTRIVMRPGWFAVLTTTDPGTGLLAAHIAGDKMPAWDGRDYSIDQALAAAVPINGPRTFENAAVESFVLMDKLDEGIEFLGRSLMGISLECARCHDHKFDPISQRDYYALLGFFQSSGHAPIPVDTTSRAEADQYALRLAALMQEKTILEGRLRRQALVASIAAKKTLGIEGRKTFHQETAPSRSRPGQNACMKSTWLC